VAKRPAPSPTRIPAPSGAVDDDCRMLARELAGVRPLQGPSRVPLTPSDPAGPRRARPAASAPWALTVERAGGRVMGAGAGVSHELVHDLGSGSLRAEATLDLHGLRAEVAGPRLVRFIATSAALGRRVVLVIGGRGAHSGPAGPVLLELAIACLSAPPAVAHVLAFVSAPPAWGGQGALLVRLRRRRG
jgi:DNA-nicking Smr family endonuclease